MTMSRRSLPVRTTNAIRPSLPTTRSSNAGRNSGIGRRLIASARVAFAFGGPLARSHERALSAWLGLTRAWRLQNVTSCGASSPTAIRVTRILAESPDWESSEATTMASMLGETATRSSEQNGTAKLPTRHSEFPGSHARNRWSLPSRSVSTKAPVEPLGRAGQPGGGAIRPIPVTWTSRWSPRMPTVNKPIIAGPTSGRGIPSPSRSSVGVARSAICPRLPLNTWIDPDLGSPSQTSVSSTIPMRG